MAKITDDIRRYAAIGAHARIAELQTEIDRIQAAFPDLDTFMKVQIGVKPEDVRVTLSKPKRKLSAAGRKAISEAAKRRWARQRKDGK